jgi:hypothetical protein
MDIKVKSATDILDFPVDFSEVLPVGDNIQTATWTIPAPVTLSNSLGTGTQIATGWLSGGTDGEYHTIHCDIVSVGGLHKRQSFVLKIVEG